MNFSASSKTYLSFKLVVVFLFGPLLSGIAIAKSSERPDIHNQPYPKAFFFRTSEAYAVAFNHGKLSYQTWNDSYQRLGGIMGKVLDEGIPERSVNLSLFTRFKKDHPDQLLLLHYNGNARDPRDASEGFFSGHWIYYVGTTTTSELAAEAGESDVHVKDTSYFQTKMGRYKNKNDDIGICLLDSSGKPNWQISEQVQLVSINHKNKTIRVKRGRYNTVPLSFPAGKAYVAVHATKGPYGKNSNLLWSYNFSTHSPRNAEGLASFDVLANDLASQFSPKGNLAVFDGVEFDVMFHSYTRGGGRNMKNLTKGLDMDADGKADWGYFNGINTYGLGVIEFTKNLREKLGDNFIIMADGSNDKNQRALRWLNGIESEGWPNIRDLKINDWSSGMNHFRYWANFARKPVFNYINHKFVNSRDEQIKGADSIPYSTHRLVMGAAQLFDAFFTYSLLPPIDEGYLIGIWDELRKGQENKTGWLGFPKGEAISLAKQQQNLLLGKSPNQLDWQGATSTISVSGKKVKIEGRQPESNIHFTLNNLPAKGKELTIAIKMRAVPPKGYTKDTPRLAWVGLAGFDSSLINENLPTTGMRVRGRTEQPIDPAITENMRFRPNYSLSNEVHDAYLSHPPRHGKAGYTFWQRQLKIPENSLLTFYTGLSQKAKTKSDGVTYKVLLQEGNKDYVVLFDKNIKEWKWQKHSISLTPWADKIVTVKFITDSGPNNNSIADHAHWGDVNIQSSLNTMKSVPSTKFVTFVGDKSFESTFYIRNIQTPTIDLDFEVEGSGPVWIESVDIYPGPETFIREFDNGIVLVNPSEHNYLFDLKKLVGSTNFRKITGSKNQDITINDGTKVTNPILVGPKDSLFLIRQDVTNQ